MKRKILLLLLMMSTLSVGCATIVLTPEAEVQIAQKSFTSVVEALDILIKADKFDVDDITKIIEFTEKGDELLDQWIVAVDKGERPSEIEAFNAVLEKLIEYRKRGD